MKWLKPNSKIKHIRIIVGSTALRQRVWDVLWAIKPEWLQEGQLRIFGRILLSGGWQSSAWISGLPGVEDVISPASWSCHNACYPLPCLPKHNGLLSFWIFKDGIIQLLVPAAICACHLLPGLHAIMGSYCSGTASTNKLTSIKTKQNQRKK